jgi:hypothetical protein
MTTKVTIDPAGHTVEVTTINGPPDGDTKVATETLEPGSPPRDFWIHRTRSLEIREVPA